MQVAETESTVCAAVVGIKVAAVLAGPVDEPFKKRRGRLNRVMPKVTTVAELLPALLRSTVMPLPALNDNATSNPACWHQLLEEYQRWRGRVLQWAVTNDQPTSVYPPRRRCAAPRRAAGPHLHQRTRVADRGVALAGRRTALTNKLLGELDLRQTILRYIDAREAIMAPSEAESCDVSPPAAAAGLPGHGLLLKRAVGTVYTGLISYP